MTDIYTIDCETDPFEFECEVYPFLWDIYDGDTHYTFDDTEKCVEFIAENEGHYYAHNGGKFDFIFLREYFNRGEKLLVIDGRLVKGAIHDSIMLDSYAILPVPLSAYEKEEFDYSILRKEERDKIENREKILDYIKSDTEYLFDLVSYFRSKIGAGLTIGACAIEYYLANWGQGLRKNDYRLGEDHFNKFRKYYFGGRVECFKKGVFDVDYKVIDINSSYPFCMLQQHPMGKHSVVSKSLCPPDYIKNSFITLKCVSTKGALPHRDERGQLSFPADDAVREYHVTGWEYDVAMKWGTLKNVEIVECVTFKRTINFKSYVEHFYKLRNNAKKMGDKVGDLVFKLMMNTLYGKYATNSAKFETHTLHDSETLKYVDCDDDNINIIALDDDLFFAREKVTDKARERGYYDVVIASSVTGLARANLFDAMMRCGLDNIYYCDTDSLITTDTGDVYLHPTKLGAWDVEAEGDRLAIAGKKLYACTKNGKEIKKASKGVRITTKDIFKIADGGIVNDKRDAPSMNFGRGGQRFIEREISIT